MCTRACAVHVYTVCCVDAGMCNVYRVRVCSVCAFKHTCHEDTWGHRRRKRVMEKEKKKHKKLEGLGGENEPPLFQ